MQGWEKRICEAYQKFNPRLVVLFGSRARGDHLESSDIDVLVVADGLPEDPRESYLLLLIEDLPQLSPLGMPTRVFLNKLEEGVPFILEVIEDGRVLCGDSRFIEHVRSLYSRVRRNYVRKGRTWVRRQGVLQRSVPRGDAFPKAL